MKSKLKKFVPFGVGRRLRGTWQRSMAYYYKGSNYKCPFCHNEFRQMLPGGFDLPVLIEKKIIGAGRRNNNICPRCYSTDRDRLIYLYLNQLTNVEKDPLKILQIAPSGSLNSFFSNLDNIHYQAGIKYHEGFYYSKDFMILDITSLDFKDNTYDVILCNHVLEHVIEDKLAMSEIYRVLKPGGWAVLQVPISEIISETYEDNSIVDPKEREAHFGQFDHVRIYGPDYTTRLESVGFTVKHMKPNENGWIVENAETYAVNPNETLYIAFKN